MWGTNVRKIVILLYCKQPVIWPTFVTCKENFHKTMWHSKFLWFLCGIMSMVWLRLKYFTQVFLFCMCYLRTEANQTIVIIPVACAWKFFMHLWSSYNKKLVFIKINHKRAGNYRNTNEKLFFNISVSEMVNNSSHRGRNN